MKPAAEAGELRRQTRGCAASMPPWHVSGEGRGEKRRRVGVFAGFKKKKKNQIKKTGVGVGGRSVYGCALLDKRLNLSGAGYPPGTPSQSIRSGS